MTGEQENAEKIAHARAEAKRARILSMVWWAQVPLVCVSYYAISKEPTVERLILIYLAAVSIIANAVTYSSKARAADAEAAGYEHP